MSYIENKRIPHLETLSKWCKGRIEELMDKFGYDEPIKLLLRDQEEEFRAKYPEYIEQYYKKDLLRSKLDVESIKNPFKIMKDVAIGWFTEDCTIMQLNKLEGIKIQRNGSEGRNLLVDVKDITNKPDFYCEYKGMCFYIEFVTDFTNEWKETGKIWMRQNKAKNLRKRNIFILGRCLLDNEFIVTSGMIYTEPEYRFDHKFGRFYNVHEDNFFKFNSSNIYYCFDWIVDYLNS